MFAGFVRGGFWCWLGLLGLFTFVSFGWLGFLVYALVGFGDLCRGAGFGLGWLFGWLLGFRCRAFLRGLFACRVLDLWAYCLRGFICVYLIAVWWLW